MRPLLILIIYALMACEPMVESPPAEFARVDQMLDSLHRASGLVGLTVSVGRNDQILWSKGYGNADIEQRVPVKPSRSLFRVGSTAKTMTATALGVLIEQGKLDLDKPVQAYVPDFPTKRWQITTRQVAGHIAGIRHYRGDEWLSARPYPTVRSGLTIFKDDSLLFEPGTRYHYSTYGWNLVSAVIEGAAGEPFLDVMQRDVFDRIGMMSTVADRVYPIIANRGRYYFIRNDSLFNSPWVDNSYKWAGGGFLSTSDDLVRFGMAHLREDVLKTETIAALWKPMQTADGKSTRYGIGWRSGRTPAGHATIGHSGGSVGGITMFLLVPEHGLVIAMITNTEKIGLRQYTERAVDLILGSE